MLSFGHNAVNERASCRSEFLLHLHHSLGEIPFSLSLASVFPLVHKGVDTMISKSLTTLIGNEHERFSFAVDSLLVAGVLKGEAGKE